MAALSDALAHQQRQMTLAQFIQHEGAMAERLKLPAAEPLTADELGLIETFQTWCIQRRVRALPARPEIVATFLSELAHRSLEYVLSMVQAIGRMHTAHAALADPTASRAVQFVLNRGIEPPDPPRSWPKNLKVLFQTFPLAIQTIIARREQEREADLRRKQNAMAEELNKLKTQTQQEIETMAKKQGWEKGVGKFSPSDTGVTRVKVPKDNAPGTDISGIVFEDTDATHNSGSGKLSNPGTRNK